jgi:amidase
MCGAPAARTVRLVIATEDIAFAGAARQAELLRSRELGARELVELHLSRIERHDPDLNAFRTVDAEGALVQADEAERRLDSGDEAPLLGVPVAVKDNLDVAGHESRHGLGATRAPAGADAEAVRRLRAAGAVIVGKTNLPELAMWGHMTESPAGGVTRNPWNPARTTCGSSGGGAAAVAAGLAPLALGTDGGGSIRLPAAACGLFGLKPQRNRIPASEHWHGLTVLGGMGRQVVDVALLTDALAGTSLVSATRGEPGKLRIAVSLKPILPTKPGAPSRRAVEQTAELLRSLGHELSERDPRYPLMLTLIMPRYLGGVAQDLEELGSESAERRTRRMAFVGRRLSGRMLRRSLDREQAVAGRIGEVFEDHDVLLTPAMAAQPGEAGRWQAKGAFSTFDAGRPYVCYTSVWNYTGQPAASVPAGFDDEGMPVGVQLVGRPGAEATLVALAAQIERARPWADRRPPLDA